MTSKKTLIMSEGVAQLVTISDEKELPVTESVPLVMPLSDAPRRPSLMVESKNCLCGLSFEKDGYCKDGHNKQHCQVDDCRDLLVYSFCYIHSGKALGLEKCPECVCCLINDKCKNPHAAWKKKERHSELSPGVVIIINNDGQFNKWREAFKSLAKRKMMD